MEYFEYIFVSILSGFNIIILDLGYIRFYYGKYRKEVCFSNEERSNLFSIPQRILIRSLSVTSMKLVDKAVGITMVQLTSIILIGIYYN